MKKVQKKEPPGGKKKEGKKLKKKTLNLDDTVTSYSDETTSRKYQNPITQRWDDTSCF